MPQFSFDDVQVASAAWYSFILSQQYLTHFQQNITTQKNYNYRLDKFSAYSEIEDFGNRRLTELIFNHGFSNSWQF